MLAHIVAHDRPNLLLQLSGVQLLDGAQIEAIDEVVVQVDLELEEGVRLLQRRQGGHLAIVSHRRSGGKWLGCRGRCLDDLHLAATEAP